MLQDIKTQQTIGSQKYNITFLKDGGAQIHDENDTLITFNQDFLPDRIVSHRPRAATYRFDYADSEFRYFVTEKGQIISDVGARKISTLIHLNDPDFMPPATMYFLLAQSAHHLPAQPDLLDKITTVQAEAGYGSVPAYSLIAERNVSPARQPMCVLFYRDDQHDLITAKITGKVKVKEGQVIDPQEMTEADEVSGKVQYENFIVTYNNEFKKTSSSGTLPSDAKLYEALKTAAETFLDKDAAVRLIERVKKASKEFIGVRLIGGR